MRNHKRVSNQQSAFSHQHLIAKLAVLTFYFLLFTITCFSQVSINNPGAAPNSSAMLDVISTTKGMLIPRMTTTQMNAISSPATGLIVFNTDCATLNYYNGGSWITLGNIGSVTTPGSITGNTVACQNSTNSYSIAPVAGASSGYNWSVPPGSTLSYGQGTTAITVTFGTVTGNLCVTANTVCGTSNPSCQLIFIGAPSAPIAGTHIPSSTQIVWNWSDVISPVSYKWGTSTTYSSATDVGTNTSYTQTGLTCNTSYTLYVWAYNTCGNSSSYATLTQPTSNCGLPCTYNSSYSFTDGRDGKTYSQVQIGTQCWMAQNLNYGACIACVNGGQTNNSIPEKYCVNSGASTDNYPGCTCPYGGLYEFGELVQYLNGATNTTRWSPVPTGNVQGVCPNGWHIPTHFEWTTLEQAVCAQSPVGPDCSNTAFPYDYIGNNPVGTNEGGKMKETGTTHWTTPNTGATNNSGFTALPGGNSWGGVLSNTGSIGWWWSATESNSSSAWVRDLGNSSAKVEIAGGNKGNGFSVRCLRD